jgi:hypothetical protein
MQLTRYLGRATENPACLLIPCDVSMVSTEFLR